MLNLLSILHIGPKIKKLELVTTTTLDVTYHVSKDENYRLTISGITFINKFMEMLHQRKNHVIFQC